MKKTLRVRAETLNKAREKFETELPQEVFILQKNEYDASECETGMYIGESLDEAIENAKKELPDPFFMFRKVVPEIKEGTNVYLTFTIQAESEWDAKYYIEKNWWHLTYKSHEFNEYENKIERVILIKKGFNGVLGLGKIMDTFQVNVFVKPQIKLKYDRVAVIVAEITDDIYLANKKLLEFAKFGSFDLKGIGRLISQGVDIHFADEHGRNVLFYSCHDFELSKLLIDKGVDYRKTDSIGDNILTYSYRNNYGVHDKIIAFLETNGIERDKALVHRINKEAREAKQREIEESKRWCPQCNKKVITVDENHKYFDDGWMEEVDIRCGICGTLIEHYRGQTR